MDEELIHNLDEKTAHKKVSLVDSSTKKYFSTHISENVNGIYPPGSLQKNLEEYAGSNLIFIASGHGSIDGITFWLKYKVDLVRLWLKYKVSLVK